jgi:hypothetical protein
MGKSMEQKEKHGEKKIECDEMKQRGMDGSNLLLRME